MKGRLILENGLVFEGLNFGAKDTKIGEICFCTSMVGYQDLLSDPSYFGKLVVMSYPLIGNYGLTDEDYDFKKIYIKGYIVRENNDLPSNFRSTRTLSDAMEENHVSGLSDVDTRELVRLIRDNGSMKAMLTFEDNSLEKDLETLKNYQEEKDLVSLVSCKKIWYARTANPTHTIIVIDLGIKHSVVKKFNEEGLNVIIVPYNFSLEQIKKFKPHGVVISNGPGNPNDYVDIVKLINSLKGKYPLLGLGLGSELIALSYGADVSKMKHGHLGANYSVKNIETNKIEILSQSHFYQISLSEDTPLQVTHRHIMDNDIEGFIHQNDKVIGIQYLIQNTLSDSENVIKRFIKLMK